ncbi:transglutaminase-like cysteine peptidase [Erythrobacter rubeus]|uniref:Transglutaminase-like cysteine peptidase n=1 Tax=Erythrobacter rubeus TaxID=2760803 RepID=A0ABR8KLG5_9SPHN|nr:transglutaminase-like cysteine peptidase [Erythrobacter rubeus]MBD2841210.1 transglutaminase-like cysteine peptidase [Erythrobacter rubeus]
MPKSHTSKNVLLAGLAGLATMAATPASAATTLAANVMVNPMAIALDMQLPAVKAQCFESDAGIFGYAANSGGSGQPSKGAAILGGEMSALDRIKARQAAATVPSSLVKPAFAQAASAKRMTPSASGVRTPSANCATLGKIASTAIGGTRGWSDNPNEFLASKRVRIGKTNFDREWQRVGRQSMSGTFRRAFGSDTDQSRAMIEQVNRWVNSEISYVEDRDLFGRADYWAGARLTMTLRKGDCEDIALTKMQLLAAAGFRREDMFLTIARDTVRNADHALLIVKLGERFVVLDNATDKVLDGAYSHDYAPVLSFNTKSAWVHGY